MRADDGDNMTQGMHMPQEVGMTIKQMVSELYNDMKIVRPIVENLNSQNLDTRLRMLETTAAQLAAVAPATADALREALHNVEVLMGDKVARDVSAIATLDTTQHVRTMWDERSARTVKSDTYAGLRAFLDSTVGKIVAVTLSISAIITILATLHVIAS